MCGIAGVWSHRNLGLSGEAFSKFFHAIQHRGPDGSKLYMDQENRMILGFHRLAIVDLTSSAMQPMDSKNKRFKLVFNGEIYNHNELRSTLTKRGHQFSTKSDSEVILAAYEEWGSNCLKEFNGMWAFVIWDSLHQTLFCARDRYGVKPLYFGTFDGRFYFSSELKSFCYIPRSSLHLNHTALNGALDVDTLPITLLENVYKLVPGEMMTVDRFGLIKKTKWWDSLNQVTKQKNNSVETTIEEFSELFESSCLLRANCDVPFAISLSGGLDSSSILAFTTKALQSDNPTRLNSMGLFHQSFGNSPEDESVYAQKVANSFGMQLNLTQVNSSLTYQLVRDSILALESSSINPIGIWAHYKEISSHGFRVVLEGHGSDELMAGYSFMGEEYARTLLRKFRLVGWGEMQHLVAQISRDNVQMNQEQNILKLFSRDFKILGGEFFRPFKDHFRGFYSQSRAKMSQETQAMVYQRNQEVEKCLAELPPLSAIRFVNFHYKTLPNILTNFDKLSMAHGVEIRSPFLDWRVVNFLLSQRKNLFLKHDLSKWILRMAAREHLPSEIIYRKNKRGFAPSIYWMRGTLGKIAEDVVNDDRFVTFSDKSVRDFRKEFSEAYVLEEWNQLLSMWGIIQMNIFTKELGIIV